MVQATNQIDLFQIAEIELSYKTTIKASARPMVRSSAECAQLLRDNWNPDTMELFEEFKVLLLNRSNKVLGIYQHSKGTIAGTIADVKLVFIAALKAGASSIILAHNHPSGSTRASQADEQTTTRFKQAGMILDIKVNDHIILTCDTYLSFADEGML